MKPEIEQSIINRLSPLRSVSVAVRAVPNRPAELGEITGNGEVLLMCRLGRAEPPSTLGQYNQRVLDEWMLQITLREFRGERGVQDFVEAIARLLIGYRPDGAGKMYLSNYEMQGLDPRGNWRVDMTFIAPRLIVEHGDEEGAIALLRRAIFETEVYETIVEPDLVVE
ncbi:Gp37 family protein [Thermoleptolyngbya sp. M55_K2018_002]|uniref:Gp37 family protein n=1 Tax=Thermoleptolyngbya sp. M55_K2018_002 TaxID=2747808 RepID=UPI0019ECB604|nr:Gp37 family protein [Thermoleptolyngbya sp. M55_K2018_002]HIK42159.1 hypothetical protein [Thermoleptolyngbya sp. M55_K2018_002]